MKDPQRLILVDGMAALYRAFYAIRELSTSDGRPTNAVFGFVRMLRLLRETWAPSHWAVIFDGGLPAARVGLLEEYKAQRKPMPDPLREQIGVCEDYCRRAAIECVRVEAQEADDVMASLAVTAAGAGAEVLLATSDKDLYQLVGGRVRIVPLAGKGAAMGVAQVREKTGVEPDRIVEWIALTGDTVDNIPGVPGVGPKTAAQLLGQFGSLDEMWRRLDDVKRERLRAVLAENHDVVDRNVAMVRLVTELPGLPGWDAFRVQPPDHAGLAALFRDLEFHSMAAELEQPDLF